MAKLIKLCAIKLQENKKRNKDMHIKLKSLLTYISKSVGKQVLIYNTGGNTNCTACIERNLTISSQTTNALNLWPSNQSHI